MRTVLAHEIAHVVRHDWLVQSVAETLRALLWWNPLPGSPAARCARTASSPATTPCCARGIRPTAYADDLLQIARLVAPASAPARRGDANGPNVHAGTEDCCDAEPQTRSSCPHSPGPARSRGRADRAALPVALLRAAQAARQPFEGVVYDTTGAVLPGVTVTLDAEAAKVEATTDPSGRFRFDSIDARATTRCRSASPGFRALRQPIQLRKDADWNRAVTLQVGDLQGDHLGARASAGDDHAAGGCGQRPDAAFASAATSALRARRTTSIPSTRRAWSRPDSRARCRRGRHRRRRSRRAGPSDDRPGAPGAGAGRGGRGAPVALRPDAAERRSRSRWS